MPDINDTDQEHRGELARAGPREAKENLPAIINGRIWASPRTTINGGPVNLVTLIVVSVVSHNQIKNTDLNNMRLWDGPEGFNSTKYCIFWLALLMQKLTDQTTPSRSQNCLYNGLYHMLFQRPTN